MISGAGDAGEQILGAAGKADDFVREHRTADQDVVVLDDEPVERHRHVGSFEPAAGELRDLGVAGIVPSLANVAGSSQRD